MLDQSIEHRVIVESARRLAMQQIKHKLKPVLAALELRFKRAYPFEQVFFQSWPEKTLDPAVSFCRRRAGDNHQTRAARPARINIVRILMSALLTKYHRNKARLKISSRGDPALKPALEAGSVSRGFRLFGPVSTRKTLCQSCVRAILHRRTS
jgi:hypothetical protein